MEQYYLYWKVKRGALLQWKEKAWSTIIEGKSMEHYYRRKKHGALLQWKEIALSTFKV